jgi:ribonuclease HI
MLKTTFEIYQDGACHNKGERVNMGLGVAVFQDKAYVDNLSLAKGIRHEDCPDQTTSNIAEWMACVEAMKIAAAIREQYPTAVLKNYSDSQVIAYQFNGSYRITNEAFRKYFIEAHKYAKLACVREIIWVRREQNTVADKLSKAGISSLTLTPVSMIELYESDH